MTQIFLTGIQLTVTLINHKKKKKKSQTEVMLANRNNILIHHERLILKLFFKLSKCLLLSLEYVFQFFKINFRVVIDLNYKLCYRNQ